jgi:hypothetical protein
MLAAYQARLLAVVRDELFSPFSSFRRWAKLEEHDVRHERNCDGDGEGVVHFSTHEPGELTPGERSLYDQIANTVVAANSGLLREHKTSATISLVEHVGRCSACQAEVFGRSVNIRIECELAGRPLSREYSLEEP